MRIKIDRDEWNEPVLTTRIFGRKFELPLSKTRVGWTLVRITGENLEFLSPTRDRIAQYPWMDHVTKPWLESEEGKCLPISPYQAAEDWISSPPCTVTDAFVADHCTVRFID